jgi:hypothetical protein
MRAAEPDFVLYGRPVGFKQVCEILPKSPSVLGTGMEKRSFNVNYRIRPRSTALSARAGV